MPVRLLNSSVLKWPNEQHVRQALSRWAQRIFKQRFDILKIGYFGSYARGDWTVGSDLDIIIVVEDSKELFERRAAEWDLTELPVPTDLLVYTKNEWKSLKDRSPKFYRMLSKEAIWL